MSFDNFTATVANEDAYEHRHWSSRYCGFGVYEAENDPPCHSLVRALVIPYWSITTPLTFLSAYLLLKMPRKSNQMKMTEPIATEGK